MRGGGAFKTEMKEIFFSFVQFFSTERGQALTAAICYERFFCSLRGD